MPTEPLSDKAVAVFAFAAYHQLTSGEPVVDVVLKDGAGHAADPKAISLLEHHDLARADGERATFTHDCRAPFSKMIDALRSAA